MGLDLLAPWVRSWGSRTSAGSPATGTSSARGAIAGNTPRWPTARPPCRSSWPSRRLQYDGIVPLHSEYKGESSYRKLTTPQLLTQSAADLMFLKKIAASMG